MEDPYSPFRCQLQRIFVYYCSFGDKQNTALLKLQSYRRLLTDLQLLSADNLDPYLPSKCDVIYYGKASPAGVTLHVFPQLLQNIASSFMPGDDSFEKMMRRHLQPLHDYIMAETDFGRALSIIRPQLFREECYALLQQYENTLKNIYSHYWTQSIKEGQGEQSKTFMKMSKELNFIPKVITKPIAQIVFGSLVQRNSIVAFRSTVKQSTKFIFDLGCFMDYLIILSHLASKESNEGDQTKLYRLLQAMQVSPGYQKISKLTKLQHFFVPLQETLQKIAQSRLTTTHNGSPMRISNKRRVKLVQTPLKKQLGEYYDPLKSKFVQLCTKKRVQSNFYLSQSTALKMLSQICPKLAASTCQNLLATVGRLSFQKFVMLLDLAAQKMRIQRERLYDQAVAYTEGAGLMLVLENMHLDQQDTARCKEVLSLVRAYLRTIYEYYHFGGGLSLTALLKLLHETQLIPSVLGQVQASTLFAAILKQGSAGISFQQFQQFLLKVTVSVRFQGELQGVERLLHMLQVVCDSKKGENLMKKNSFSVREHPLYKVRLIFGDSYSKMADKQQQLHYQSQKQ